MTSILTETPMITGPAWLPFETIGVSLVVVFVVLTVLSRALLRARWSDDQRASVVRTAAILLFGWLAVAVVLAVAGFYRGAYGRVPTLQFGVLVPLLIGALALRRSQVLSRVVDAVPQSWVIGAQVYRVVGITIVVLGATGELPGVFAWPAGFGDVAVGLLAAMVAWVASRDSRGRSWMIGAWNVLGLADFAVAFATGFLSSPSPFQRLAFDHPNVLVSTFPLVLIPTFVVPVSVLLHVVSLMKLGRGRARLPQTPRSESVPAAREPSTHTVA